MGIFYIKTIIKPWFTLMYFNLLRIIRVKYSVSSHMEIHLQQEFEFGAGIVKWPLWSKMLGLLGTRVRYWPWFGVTLGSNGTTGLGFRLSLYSEKYTEINFTDAHDSKNVQQVHLNARRVSYVKNITVESISGCVMSFYSGSQSRKSSQSTLSLHHLPKIVTLPE